MIFSGERYIPELDAADISYEHWHRYLFATALVKDKVVLDIASGEGYGSSLLAHTARHVTGVDLSFEALIHAAHKYRAPNLEFRQGSVDCIPVPGREILDAIVSFETIEHVGEAEQTGFAREVKRLLKPGGIFIISTPDKAVYSDRTGFHNDFHKKELYRTEFLDFLRGFFRTVCLFSQRVYPASYIWPLQERGGVATEYQVVFRDGHFGPAVDDLKEGMYLVALCTDDELTKLAPSILLDPGDRKTQIFSEQIMAQQGSIESLSAQLQKQAHVISNLALDLTARETALRDSESKLTEHTAQATELNARLQTVEHERDLLRQQLEIQEAALYEQAAFAQRIQQHLESLDAKLAAADAELLSANPSAHGLVPAGRHSAASTSSGASPARKAADRQEYQKIIQRIRRLVAKVVPAGATIAVVNKGDPELLKLEGRQGWHFPQNYDGQYAGHYPDDSAAAIRELEKLRTRGAQYVIFPATALWWLDHYKEFAQHLTTRYSVVGREEQTCVIFGLGDSSVEQRAPRRLDCPEHDYLVGQVRAVVDSIVPADARVLVVSKGDPTLVDLGARSVSHFPQGGATGAASDTPADSAAAIAELEELRQKGAQFLVMPKTVSWWFDKYQEFTQHLETHYRAIVRQKHVCHVFDLKEQ